MTGTLNELTRLLMAYCPAEFFKVELLMLWQFGGSRTGPNITYFDGSNHPFPDGGLRGVSMENLREISKALENHLDGPEFLDGRFWTADGYLANTLLLTIAADGRPTYEWVFDREREIEDFERIKPYLNEDELAETVREFEYFLAHKGSEWRLTPEGKEATKERWQAEEQALQAEAEAEREARAAASPAALLEVVGDAMRQSAPDGWVRLVFDGAVLEGVDVNGAVGTEVQADFQAGMPDGSRVTFVVDSPMEAMNALMKLRQNMLKDDGTHWTRIRIIIHRQSDTGTTNWLFDPEGGWQGEA